MSNQLKEMATRPQTKQITVRDKVINMIPEYRMALGGDDAKAQKMARMVLSAIHNPMIAKCSVPSILGASLDATFADLNIFNNEYYLVPKKVKGVWECVGMTSIVGYIKLANNLPEFTRLSVRTVLAGDLFDVSYGSENRIIHKPDLNREGIGTPTHFYAIAKMNGEEEFEVMSLAEIDHHRKVYAPDSFNSYSGWVRSYPEMAKKTVAHRLLKRIPKSSNMQRLVANDGKIQRFKEGDGKDFEFKQAEYVIEDIPEEAGEDLNEFELLDVAKNLLKGKSKLTETKKSKFKKDIDEYAINGSSKDAINKLIAEIKEA